MGSQIKPLITNNGAIKPRDLARLGLSVDNNGQVYCKDLRAVLPVAAQALGWGPDGRITKGSVASKGMSMEARANGGGVPKMKDGGVSASFQSIAATGYVKPAAALAIGRAINRVNERSNGGWLANPSSGKYLEWDL
mmetsp:Transcript_36914/g.104168  ORF Transcript_36914/g.104168 Transcript_36914/m.104168 type:complete len:137 (+) Transcript_36914:825-1235(+)